MDMKHCLIKDKFQSDTREVWHQQIQAFIIGMDSDPEFKGKISYRCIK